MPYISPDWLQYLSDEKREHLLATHMRIGYHPEAGDDLMIPEVDRRAGTYILGKSGMGKSALLENMIDADMRAGNAVIVIDPHTDLVAHCLAQVPSDRLAQAFLLDMEDERFPFGINLFSVGTIRSETERTQHVNRITHVFNVLWPETRNQQHMPRYLRSAILTLLDNPGSTLVDMYSLLKNEPYRRSLVARVNDQSVREFWEAYEAMMPAARVQQALPLINRLESLFMGRSLVRNIVGQRQNTIDFRQAIEHREIILIRLPVKILGSDAQLVGTILMSQIHAAVFSFANVPEQKRPGVSVYVDEFQTFSSSDFAEIFTEGRKFSIRLTIANQYKSQLPDYLQEAVDATRTQICFRTTIDDARDMARMFPEQEATIQPEDIEAHPVAHLLTYGSDNPFVQVFIDQYLRPLQGHKRGNRVEMNHFDFDWIEGKRLDNPREADPTPYLDSLLYQVMRNHDADVSIPAQAVIGFANCGQKFYGQVRGMKNSDNVLKNEVQFPRNVVAMDDDGLRWTRPPRSGMEQLFHCIFHLRMTMYALEQEPIGKKTTSSTNEVAQMLSSLPPRAAFVRTTDTVGVIYTNNTPPRLTGQDLVQRAKIILTQTRQKYCHTRAEIEQALTQPRTVAATTPASNTKMPVAVSRWEEV